MARDLAAASHEIGPLEAMIRLRSWLHRRGDLVLDARAHPPAVEGDDLIARTIVHDRVAVLAHWSPTGRVTRSTSELIRALQEHGYVVVLASSAPGARSLEWPSGQRPAGLTVLRRSNTGYDFGSWATALAYFPVLTRSPQILLCNDSLIGPFASIEHMLARFDRSAADAWAMTDSNQFTYHLQSYCIGFKSGCLLERPLAEFWQRIRTEDSRDAVIWRYEIGLGKLLSKERFVTECAIPYGRVVRAGENPTIVGWRKLLDEGFPFVKRQLLREPGVARDAAAIPGVLRDRFGVEVGEWYE